MIGDLIKLFRWQDALGFILTYIFTASTSGEKEKALRMVIAMLALPFYLIAQWIDLLFRMGAESLACHPSCSGRHLPAGNPRGPRDD
jgi:hypothetical protein